MEYKLPTNFLKEKNTDNQVGKKLIESQFEIGTIFCLWWKMKDSPLKGMTLVKSCV